MAHDHQDHEQRIRERAHRMWEDEGRPHGKDREHWQRAMEALEKENDVREGHRAGDSRPGQPGSQSRVEGVVHSGAPGTASGSTPGQGSTGSGATGKPVPTDPRAG